MPTHKRILVQWFRYYMNKLQRFWSHMSHFMGFLLIGDDDDYDNHDDDDDDEYIKIKINKGLANTIYIFFMCVNNNPF